MKDIIGAIVFAAFVAVVFWAVEGLYGISIGSNDYLTRSFILACAKVGIGGAN